MTAQIPPGLMDLLGPAGGRPADLPPEAAQRVAPPPDQAQLPPEMMPPEAMPPPGQPENSMLPPGAGMVDPTTGDDNRPVPEEVNYTWGDCCATCMHFMAPEGCEEVNGHIRPDGICDMYAQQTGLPFDATWGDPV